VSDTREDSVYPEAGDPLVDALHYHLALAWTPAADHLEATERLTFRATADSQQIRLDFDDALTIDSLAVDGEDAGFQQADKDLTIEHPVTADTRYVVELAYSGTPETYPTPFSEDVGWGVTSEHETWTLQAPYGGFTWYAVNDQPADKAFYDFTLTVPEPWTGVSNGELLETTDAEGLRTTQWHLAEPASSYLITVAFADYAAEELESDSGVPITLWYPTDNPGALGETTYAPKALAWLEQYLGPYPFDTFGIVIVDGEIIMETQTMVTLSVGETSRALVVHELAHHWYGNTVGPADWRDLWMNEGWATYFHGMWQAEDEGVSIDAKMDEWAADEEASRLDAGPPADYDPTKFLADNVYYSPALMLHELREDLGDDAFFDLAREWPEQQENRTADRDKYWAWLEQETGLELTAFLEDWLLGPRTPDRRD
jgi:aminopeptidase N